MDKIFTIKERILYFIDYQNIKKGDFFDKTEIASSNFKGIGMKSEIGGDKISKILSIYSEINPEWLLTGNGSMLRSEKQTLDIKPTQQEASEGIVDKLLSRIEILATENGQLKSDNAILKKENENLMKVLEASKNKRGSIVNKIPTDYSKSELSTLKAAEPKHK